MVIAMVAVLVVQTTVYNVVNVVAMWHGFVSAAFAVNVSCAFVGGVAAVWVLLVHVQNVFIVMSVVFVVQMTIVQVVNVVAVFDGGVSAVCAVLVVVMFVCFASHDCSPEQFLWNMRRIVQTLFQNIK